MRIYLVWTKDWDGRSIVHSVHKTQDGAEMGVKEANEKYQINSSYWDVDNLKD